MKPKNVIEIVGHDLSRGESGTSVVNDRTLPPSAKKRRRPKKVGPFFGPHRDNCG